MNSSLVYLQTVGRLGNSMSTLAITLGLSQLGFTPVIDLVNFQILDTIFNNIRGSGVKILEEVFCDPSKVIWEKFDKHVDELELDKSLKGKALLFWHSGVSVDQSVHGLTGLLTNAVHFIRKTFIFR